VFFTFEIRASVFSNALDLLETVLELLFEGDSQISSKILSFVSSIFCLILLIYVQAKSNISSKILYLFSKPSFCTTSALILFSGKI